MLDVGDERLDELGLDLEAGAGGWQLDGAAQLLRLHRADEDVVGAQQLGQSGVGGATSVEVGSGRDDHHSSLLRVAGSSDERLGEVRSLLLGAAGGEQLLELVDRQR